MRSMKRLLGRAVIAAALVVGVSGTAQAVTLGLVAGNPDIQVIGASVSYENGTLLVLGNTFTALDGTGAAIAFDANYYSLTAEIDSSGAFSSGSFLIKNNTDLLLSGVLTLFGFQGIGEFANFEFLFDTVEDNTNLGFGPKGGIKVNYSQTSGDWGGFASAFNGTASVDNFSVPVSEPTSLLLFGAGLLGFAARRRRAARR
jgi:hypothetical protein